MHLQLLLEVPSENLEEKVAEEGLLEHPKVDNEQSSSDEYTFKEFICGEEALRISPLEPYCLRRPIRRGHFNVSQNYPQQQVFTWTATCFLLIVLSSG